MTRRLLAGALTLALAGCAVGPNYERPEIVVPEGWRDSTLALRDSSYANLPWWQVFADTTLQRLILIALRENQDVRIALARVNEARALLGIQRLEFYPQIDIFAGAERFKLPDSITGAPQPERNAFHVGGSLAWEIDLWGRIRRLDESAQAALLATEQGRRGVILTIVSEVARVYLELRDLDQELAITERQRETRRESLQLASARFEGGLTSELDVRQGEGALANAEGAVFRLLRERQQKENELSILLGRVPGDIPRGLPLTEQEFPDVIPAGLPSELLLRRPDVQQAEEELRAANAQIGAAIAALFPTISLTGSGGTASRDFDNLFSAGTGFWNLAVNLFQPLINRGRNLKQVHAEQARTEAAVAFYERTVLTAFREVEDGLVGVQSLRDEADAAGRAAEAARQAVGLATLRYEGGVDSYLNLLDAQREQLTTELLESQLVRLQRVSVVQLYKALGGGWDPVTDTLALPLPDTLALQQEQ